MKKKILFYFLICVVTLQATRLVSGENPSVFSATKFLVASKKAYPSVLATSAFAKSQGFTLVRSEANAIFTSNKSSNVILRDFPIGKNIVGSVVLTKQRPILDGDSRIWIRTKNGLKEFTSLPSMTAYKGTIEGDENSTVVVTYADGEMYASVFKNDSPVLEITPRTDALTKGDKSHLMTCLEDVPAGSYSFSCAADHLPDYHVSLANSLEDFDRINNADKKGLKLQADTTLLSVKVAIEVDRFVAPRFSWDPVKITAYVHSIFASVNSVYEREVNCTMAIGDMIIASQEEPDPYTANATGDISTLLGQFSSFWRNNYQGISRNIAHLMTGPGQGSGSTVVGGIASLDALCSMDRGYGVSGVQSIKNLPLVAYNWDSFVVAHEIGHNYSSPHTHTCVWSPPLDTCVNQSDIDDACTNLPQRNNPGSIMSYCHLRPGVQPRYTFLAKPAARVRQGAASRTTCIKAPATPTVRLSYPLGGVDQVLAGGNTVRVFFRSSGVSQVNVQYSTNSGTDWTNIATNVAGTAREVDWTIPAITTTNALVRVFSVDNQNVGDTSYTTFSIKAANLEMVNPPATSSLYKVGVKDTVMITWVSEQIDKVHLEISTDNGNSWTRTATDLTVDKYLWTAPSTPTTGIKFKVVNAANIERTSVSPEIQVGIPTLSLVSPKASDTICAGKVNPIKWESDFCRNVRIELSLDGGSSYVFTNRISASTSALPQSFDWTPVATKLSGTARIRLTNISSVTENQVVSSTPANFAIQVCLGIEEEQEELNATVVIDKVYPNPANQDLQLFVKNLGGISKDVAVELVATDGRTVSLGSQRLNAGAQTLSLNVSNVAQGSYLLNLKSGTARLVVPVSIQR